MVIVLKYSVGYIASDGKVNILLKDKPIQNIIFRQKFNVYCFERW